MRNSTAFRMAIRLLAPRLASTSGVRHDAGVTATIQLDPCNRIVLSREMRRAAGIVPRQKLKVSAAPGKIILELEVKPNGKVARRGKLKVWTGSVPATPLAEAVGQARHYER